MTNPDFSPQALRITVFAAGICAAIGCFIAGLAAMS